MLLFVAGRGAQRRRLTETKSAPIARSVAPTMARGADSDAVTASSLAGVFPRSTETPSTSAPWVSLSAAAPGLGAWLVPDADDPVVPLALDPPVVADPEEPLEVEVPSEADEPVPDPPPVVVPPELPSEDAPEVDPPEFDPSADVDPPVPAVPVEPPEVPAVELPEVDVLPVVDHPRSNRCLSWNRLRLMRPRRRIRCRWRSRQRWWSRRAGTGSVAATSIGADGSVVGRGARIRSDSRRSCRHRWPHLNRCRSSAAAG
ncbi:hypothetical protein GQR58_029972 [Nymphon striatum]|nr:hypothetical protein GQR58_029972 [Nymphon striatum]